MQTCESRVTQRGMDIMKCTPIHASAVNSGKRIWSRVKLSRAINNIDIKLIKFHVPTQRFVVFNFPTVLPTENPVRFGCKSAKMATLLPRFNNVIFRHHYVIQKNSSSIEIEQS